MNVTPSNKTALITGGAKRIGAAISAFLHQQGFNVVIHCNQSQESAKALVSELNELREESATYVQGDLADLDFLAELMDSTIEHFGTLNLLVNNASAFYPTPISDLKEEDWDSLINPNAKAPLFLSKLASEELKRQQGSIINLIDIYAQFPLADHTLYCMSKAALQAMTKSLAIDLAPDVRVNGISPGAILWPETNVALSYQEKVLKGIPLGHLGNAEDITAAVGYLAEARYVTGQILNIDGGRSLGF